MLDPEAKGDRLEQEFQVPVSAVTLKNLPYVFGLPFYHLKNGATLCCLVSYTERLRMLWSASKEDYQLFPHGNPHCSCLKNWGQGRPAVYPSTIQAGGSVGFRPPTPASCPIVLDRKEPGRELEPLQRPDFGLSWRPSAELVVYHRLKSHLNPR